MTLLGLVLFAIFFILAPTALKFLFGEARSRADKIDGKLDENERSDRRILERLRHIEWLLGGGKGKEGKDDDEEG